MITLVQPSKTYLKSYMEAYDAYTAMGGGSYGMTNARETDIFQKYDNYRDGRNLKSDRVGANYYWLVDEDKDYFIGEITIRHRLNAALLLRGGHIGYMIRCNEWGKGYGTHMLKLALERAKEMGLERVLITCDERNAASAKVMEKNGCVLQDKVQTEGGLTRRYWKML